MFDDFPDTQNFPEKLRAITAQVTELEKRLVNSWQSELTKRLEAQDSDFALQVFRRGCTAVHLPQDFGQIDGN